MEFDLENPITFFQDQHSLFSIEDDHMLSQNYLFNLNTNDHPMIMIRREAISFIFMFSCNLDPFLSYLAVNYLDRFLSIQDIQKPKPWILRLIAVSCVSLSAKMLKTEDPVFQCDDGVIFDTRTITRMEMLILGALKWRMRSITPFSFIKFFVFLFKVEDPLLIKNLQDRAIKIMFNVQNDIRLLTFKASVIAASAYLSASNELFPMQLENFSKAISKCPYVNKENMLKCYNIMKNVEKDGRTNSSLNTPVNILDWQYSNMNSEKTATL